MAQRSIDLIQAMLVAAEAAQPITGRGIGYKLFAAGFIPSMSNNDMQKVYRLLRIAREQGDIPWEWIVDETRELERTSAWDNPPIMLVVLRNPIAVTSGISNRCAAKSGARKERYGVCSSRC